MLDDKITPSAAQSPCAIVTGGARGIGRGISLALASDGFKVAAVGTRPESDPNVREYLTALHTLSPESIYIQGDISDPDDRRRIVDHTIERFGSLETLVNNAGVAPLVRGDLLEMSEESLDRLLNINLKGTFFLTQYAARRMIELSKSGNSLPRTIITLTSISAETSSISRGEYCISKAGLSMAVKLFADRLASEGIYCYELRPGIIETDMTAVVRDKYIDLIENHDLLPIARMGQSSDVGRAALALAKGYFSYSTGDIINVDGGFHISRL